MIDNILYASSTQLNLKLLTLDTELKEFIHEKRLKDTLIFPSYFTILTHKLSNQFWIYFYHLGVLLAIPTLQDTRLVVSSLFR